MCVYVRLLLLDKFDIGVSITKSSSAKASNSRASHDPPTTTSKTTTNDNINNEAAAPAVQKKEACGDLPTKDEEDEMEQEEMVC
jgi:hypothetical protein